VLKEQADTVGRAQVVVVESWVSVHSLYVGVVMLYRKRARVSVPD